MDSETTLSLATTTAPTDDTADSSCPSALLALRGLLSSPQARSANPPDALPLPWDGMSSDAQSAKNEKLPQQPPQQQQQQQHTAKRLCTGLFNGFRGCKRSSNADNESSASSTVSDTPSRPAISRSVEEFSQRSLDHFPSPSLLFPQPALEFDFRIAVKLRPEPSRLEPRSAQNDPRRTTSEAQPAAKPSGPNGSADPRQQQQREITAVSSGSWSGSFGHGKVLAGGYDLGQARGFRPIRIVEGVFVMQTTDDTPAILEMRTRGSLSGPCDVLDHLLSPVNQSKTIDPRRYGFRMFSTIKTTDKRYAEIVNCGLWVASGVWRGDELIIDAYRVT